MRLYVRRAIGLLALTALAIVFFTGDRDNRLYPVLIGGRAGYINAKGTVKINPAYEEAQYFSQGLAGVAIKGGCGFIDKKGDVVVPLKYRNVKPFSEGFAAVATEDAAYGNLWGYINQSGKVMISPEYRLAGSFSDGMAFVQKISGKDNVVPGYITRKGDFTPLPEGMEKGWEFSEGLAYVRGASTGGFIGKNGKFRTRHDFYDGVKFQERLASVADQPGKYGFINRTGAFAIAPRYDYALDFNGGIAPVRKNNRFGYIDLKGEYAVPPRFDFADSFTDEDVARVAVNGKYGFIDRKGKVVVQPTFDWIGLCEDGFWPFSKAGTEGYIDKKGTVIWSGPETASKKSLWGLWDSHRAMQ